MASYHIRQRDPLLDSNTQAVLERRGKELVGLALVGLAVLAGMLLGSYTPTDPSWLSATDEPARNLLGRTGASIASPLVIIAGYGAWGLAIILAGWGARFVIHRGEDRVLNRSIFAPIAVALASVYASTLVPPADWNHSFGLGGLFGDTVLGALLGVAPVQASFGLKVISALMFVVATGFVLFVMGFNAQELRVCLRFGLRGLVMAYANLMALLGQGASGALRAAQNAQGRRRHNREEPAPRHDPGTGSAFAAAPPLHAEPRAARPGLLARMPALVKRTAEPAPEPELVEPDLSWHAQQLEAPSEERIKAKIADAIKSRGRAAPPLSASRVEPPVVRPRGPQPLVLDTTRPPAPTTLAPLGAAAVAGPAWQDTLAPLMEIEEDDLPDTLPLLDDDDDLAAWQDTPPAGPIPAGPRKVVQHAPHKPAAPSRQAQAEAQPHLQFTESAPAYEHPPLSLLSNPEDIPRHMLSDEALEENARMLESVLDDYGVKGEIVSVRPGPVVTMYELEPAPGLKASRVIGLADDIARSMSALSARVSTVPGRSVIGIELPNAHREKVVLREILSARDFGDSNMRLPLALGKDIGGQPVVANLTKMPHLLIAGTTGSGKSVAINTMILSLLYKLSPEECRLIMIDPKMLELSVYDGIPHLLSPVVTDPKKAVVALKWVVGEMEDRYRKMSKMGVRNIDGYNGRVREALAKGEMFKRTIQTGFDEDTGEPVFETEEFEPKTIPYIVVIVDEMADLMMVAGKEIEACIQRLAQMARASGIHLIMATQRPSVDVITGTIKANFPTRISFQVTSKIDSRTILGEQGAEQLLGMGDMLYMAGGGRITRIHGPFVSDEEVEEIVTHLKSFGPAEYMSGVVDGPEDGKADDIDMVLGLGGNTDGEDALYDQAVAVVLKDRKCSTSYIQRKLGIGYNKAARLVEQMEEQGLVSTANHVGKREILVPEQ